MTAKQKSKLQHYYVLSNCQSATWNTVQCQHQENGFVYTSDTEN